jgi:hypothetical protein
MLNQRNRQRKRERKAVKRRPHPDYFDAKKIFADIDPTELQPYSDNLWEKSVDDGVEVVS